jgi:hypothetical protein
LIFRIVRESDCSRDNVEILERTEHFALINVSSLHPCAAGDVYAAGDDEADFREAVVDPGLFAGQPFFALPDRTGSA